MSKQPITANYIIQSALTAAEMDASEFVTETEALNWLNLAVGELHEILVGLFEDYFLSRVELQPGKMEYVLPDDFFKLLKVYDTDSGQPIRRFTLDDNLPGSYQSDSFVKTRYRIMGNKIIFNKDLPHLAELWYAPQPQIINDLKDELQVSIPINWSGFLADDITARMLAKEESDYSFYELRKAQFVKRCKEVASERDAGESKVVVDVYRRDLEVDDYDLTY